MWCRTKGVGVLRLGCKGERHDWVLVIREPQVKHEPGHPLPSARQLTPVVEEVVVTDVVEPRVVVGRHEPLNLLLGLLRPLPREGFRPSSLSPVPS